ncbi:MAG TPA: two-component regulator propeller domain-containing protein, partial [Prolixibacteraceae bacterium]|nr:two-component regulator propeller domain-containing protein [Prolixibacteraceae bacterium]
MIRALLIWAGLMTWALMACALPLSFSHLTIRDGLSQSTVKAITQDGEGFLWFGTADGLNRYDAYHFTVFRNDPADSLSPGGNDVSSLYYDPAEALLWVGTEDGGISLYDRTTETFTRLRH